MRAAGLPPDIVRGSLASLSTWSLTFERVWSPVLSLTFPGLVILEKLLHFASQFLDLSNEIVTEDTSSGVYLPASSQHPQLCV